MTLRPASVFAATGSTSASCTGVQDRSLRLPSASRTTTTVSGPFVDRPASRTAAPAVVPAGTRMRAAGVMRAEVVTAGLSLGIVVLKPDICGTRRDHAIGTLGPMRPWTGPTGPRSAPGRHVGKQVVALGGGTFGAAGAHL